MTKLPSKMPKTVGSKKVSAPLRQSPGTAVEKVAPVSGAQIKAVVVELVRDIGEMIDAARKQVALTANAALTGLYWQIGQRVHTEVLEERRAEFGAQIVSAAGRQLEARYGRGFGEKSLRHMIRFARVPQRGDCLRTAETIVVEPLQSARLHGGRAEVDLLCGDVPGGRVVDARPRRAHRRHVVLGAGIDAVSDFVPTHGATPKRKGRKR